MLFFVKCSMSELCKIYINGVRKWIPTWLHTHHNSLSSDNVSPVCCLFSNQTRFLWVNICFFFFSLWVTTPPLVISLYLFVGAICYSNWLLVMERINFENKTKQISSVLWIWTGAQPIWKEWMEVHFFCRCGGSSQLSCVRLLTLLWELNKIWTKLTLLSMNWNLFNIWLVH